MKINNIIPFASILILAACASKPDHTWVKSKSGERDYIIADSSCTAESYKAAPAVSMSCGGGEDNSICIGYQAGLAGKMKKIRAKIYEGCMIEKGWEKQPIQQRSLVDSFLRK